MQYMPKSHNCLGGFSALQRAENSSIITNFPTSLPIHNVSVLFSEPKIPQFKPNRCSRNFHRPVSVLFSEPKIPQSIEKLPEQLAKHVSVLFSEPKIPQSELNEVPLGTIVRFQCSSASRKFLNSRNRAAWFGRSAGFSALQRAENSSIW